MGGLRLVSEVDSPELFDSRVLTEIMPQNRRSFRWNLPFTPECAKSRKILSLEDDLLGFLDSIDPVDQKPPQDRRSFHRNHPVSSSFSNSRVSVEHRRSFHQMPPLKSSCSKSRECIASASLKLHDSRASIQNPPSVSLSSSSRVFNDENSSKLLNSRVSAAHPPEPRRSFHRNPPLTSSFTKSRKSFSIERVKPVPEPHPSAMSSISSYNKGGLVTVENDDTEDTFDPRLSIERSPYHRRSSHRLSISSVLPCVSSRSSFCYDKLAQVPIRLSIVKLDGSSFDVDVMKNATVADLKQAIENFFSCLPIEEAGLISWQHVWENFCLSHGGFKLLGDGENLREYGMKDGDKLHFIRHISVTKHPTKQKTRKQIDAPKSHIVAEEKAQEVEADYIDSENMQLKHELEDNLTHRQSILHRFFRGLFVDPQVSSGKQLTYKGTKTTRRSGGFVGCFRNSKGKSQSYSSKALGLQSFK